MQIVKSLFNTVKWIGLQHFKVLNCEIPDNIFSVLELKSIL